MGLIGACSAFFEFLGSMLSMMPKAYLILLAMVLGFVLLFGVLKFVIK